MRVLAIRHCVVHAQAEAIARFLDRVGFPRREMKSCDETSAAADFAGSIFPAGDSWVEVWPAGPGMPECTMLQVVVDDADAFAAHARQQDLDVAGPTDAHGERIYFVTAPGGIQMSFQSALPSPTAGVQT